MLNIIEIAFLAPATRTTSATFTIATDGELDVMYAPALVLHLMEATKKTLMEATEVLKTAMADGTYTIVLI